MKETHLMNSRKLEVPPTYVADRSKDEIIKKEKKNFFLDIIILYVEETRERFLPSCKLNSIYPMLFYTQYFLFCMENYAWPLILIVLAILLNAQYYVLNFSSSLPFLWVFPLAN